MAAVSPPTIPSKKPLPYNQQQIQFYLRNSEPLNQNNKNNSNNHNKTFSEIIPENDSNNLFEDGASVFSQEDQQLDRKLPLGYPTYQAYNSPSENNQLDNKHNITPNSLNLTYSPNQILKQSENDLHHQRSTKSSPDENGTEEENRIGFNYNTNDFLAAEEKLSQADSNHNSLIDEEVVQQLLIPMESSPNFLSDNTPAQQVERLGVSPQVDQVAHVRMQEEFNSPQSIPILGKSSKFISPNLQIGDSPATAKLLQQQPTKQQQFQQISSKSKEKNSKFHKILTGSSKKRVTSSMEKPLQLPKVKKTLEGQYSSAHRPRLGSESSNSMELHQIAATSIPANPLANHPKITTFFQSSRSKKSPIQLETLGQEQQQQIMSGATNTPVADNQQCTDKSIKLVSPVPILSQPILSDPVVECLSFQTKNLKASQTPVQVDFNEQQSSKEQRRIPINQQISPKMNQIPSPMNKESNYNNQATIQSTMKVILPATNNNYNNHHIISSHISVAGKKSVNEATTTTPVQATNSQTVALVDPKLEFKYLMLQEDLKNKELLISEKVQMLKIVEHENREKDKALRILDASFCNYKEKVQSIVIQQLLDIEKLKREETKLFIAKEKQRLGEYVQTRECTKFDEIWQEGTEFKKVEERLSVIKLEKEELEKKKKLIKGNRKSATEQDGSQDSQISEELKSRINLSLQFLQKEESDLFDNKKNLEHERFLFIQKLKRFSDEQNSRYGQTWPFLGERYQLLSLLGRGGFSEVYKAYDLLDFKEVACKIHQLNLNWSEQSKANYIKHAVRESKIHSELKHPNIVQLYDTVEIDNNSFATVLEYCEGPDLYFYLKKNKILQEKEAKMLIRQILCALKYMNSQKTRIIHYDLKPQNIIFHKGELKISDFGLSKIFEDGQTRMELTSQGVGTYWYLPPETFEFENNAQISPKVDIWSVGVIFFEMVFGQRPFGNNKSQDQILKENIILKSTQVNFPSKPNNRRWDISKAWDNPYMNIKIR